LDRWRSSPSGSGCVAGFVAFGFGAFRASSPSVIGLRSGFVALCVSSMATRPGTRRLAQVHVTSSPDKSRLLQLQRIDGVCHVELEQRVVALMLDS
jgi:hypothetical protein